MAQDATKVAKTNTLFASAHSALKQEVESAQQISGFVVAQFILDLLVILEKIAFWVNKEPLGSNPNRLEGAIKAAFAAMNTLKADRSAFFETKKDEIAARNAFLHFAKLLDEELRAAEGMPEFDIPDGTLDVPQANFQLELAFEHGQLRDFAELYKEAANSTSTALNTLRSLQKGFLADRKTIERLLERAHALRKDATVFKKVGGSIFNRVAGIRRLLKEGRGLTIVRAEYIGLDTAIATVEDEISAKSAAIRVAETLTPPPAKHSKKARRYVAKGERTVSTSKKEKKGKKKGEQKEKKGKRQQMAAAA
jgi:hypothetical protein